MVQLMPLPPHHFLLHQNPEWFTFLVPALYAGCPGKEAVKRGVCHGLLIMAFGVVTQWIRHWTRLLKTHDLRMTDQVAWHENGGPPKSRGVKV